MIPKLVWLFFVATGVAPPPLDAAMEKSLAEEVERYRGSFDGVVLVGEGERVVLEIALGVRDRRSVSLNQVDTLFRVGSLTKQFTAMTILSLVDEGKLHLDAPVSSYFPNLPHGALSHAGRSATVHDLLRHVGGVPRTERVAAYKKALWRTPLPRQAVLEPLLALPLSFTPGERFEYSNGGYVVLGEVARVIAGKETFSEVLNQQVLTKLGLGNTGIGAPSSLPGSRLARGTFYANTWIDSETALGIAPSVLVDWEAAGAMYSTARDLFLYSQEIWKDEPQVLERSTRDLMLTPGEKSYGYGVVIEEDSGVQHVWHNGAISPLGYRSEWHVFPASGTTIVVLSNNDDLVSLAEPLARNLCRIRLGQPPDRERAQTEEAFAKATVLSGVFWMIYGAGRWLLIGVLGAWLLVVTGLHPKSLSALALRAAAPAAFLAMGFGLVIPSTYASASAAGLLAAAVLLRIWLSRKILPTHWTPRREILRYLTMVSVVVFVAYRFGGPALSRAMLVVVPVVVLIYYFRRHPLSAVAARRIEPSQ